MWLLNIFFLINLCSVLLADASEELWSNFKVKHKRTYKTLEEEQRRFAIFQENLKIIQEHNEKFYSGFSKYKLGINKFADLSKEEFIRKRLSRNFTHDLNPFNGKLFKKTERLNDDLPDSIDWSELGAVTDVKDQGDCNSGWAFATAGSLEGQLYLVNNTLLDLSEQYLIDCDNLTVSNSNDGCQGGRPLLAMSFLRNRGIPLETDDPYKAEQQDCIDLEPYIKGLKNFHRTTMDENSLMNSVGTAGPVAVELDASNFQLYDGGIFEDTKCSMIVSNHAALVVGYGTDEYDYNYWLVKNSWGPDWGEFGYIRMARGFNQCGVATDTVYPEL